MLRLINYKNILHVLGISLLLESMFMLVIVPISWYYHETCGAQIIAAFGVTFITGAIMALLTTKHHQSRFTLRESFVLIPHIWIIVPLFGTLPYLFTHSIPNFINATFESYSGFTTTGSSILADIEALPKSILFWRALTHWLGGLGIIVLVVAIMRHLKIGGSHLMAVEGSLLGVDKIKPRLIDVAKQLWLIYLILTVAETVLLMISGMDLFDASTHSFATVATGGFSTKNASIIGMSPQIQYIITIFMILSGVNFSLHFFAFSGNYKKVFRDEEFKTYILIILITTLLISLDIKNLYHTYEEAFRHSFFQVASILTCTGFASADYELWPSFSHMALFIIMFIGASVGSTGGGIKVARVVIIFKSAQLIFKKLIRPNTVSLCRYNNAKINDIVIKSVFAFVSIYVLTFIVGTLILCLAGNDLPTSAGGVVTTLGGIGPGFGQVGPTENFMGLNDFSKIYLSANMLLGRLEILSVLVLFHPAFRKL